MEKRRINISKGPVETQRPFVVKVEESVARAFITTVKHRGMFVRETVVSLMREYVEKYGAELKQKDERNGS